MTPEQLETIKARLAAATPGPWRYSCAHDTATIECADGGGIAYAVDYTDPADAEFIANAPTDIEALLIAYDDLQIGYDERCMLSAEYISEITTLKTEIERINHLRDLMAKVHDRNLIKIANLKVEIAQLKQSAARGGRIFDDMDVVRGVGVNSMKGREDV